MSAGRRTLLRFEVPLAALGAALLTFAAVFARTGIPSWIPPAPMVRAGVASPLTGMTRSFVSMARGDWGGAFSWHPLGPLCFVVCAAMLATGAVSLMAGRRLEEMNRWLARRPIWIAVAPAFAVVWARQIMEVTV